MNKMSLNLKIGKNYFLVVTIMKYAVSVELLEGILWNSIAVTFPASNPKSKTCFQYCSGVEVAKNLLSSLSKSCVSNINPFVVPIRMFEVEFEICEQLEKFQPTALIIWPLILVIDEVFLTNICYHNSFVCLCLLNW